jgi:hypothetical protein
MNLKELVKTFSNDALELTLDDALRRDDEQNARIASDEMFERELHGYEEH